MEFEDLEEKLDWEARRVATAFGVEKFELSFASGEDNSQLIYIGESENKEIHWGIDTSTCTTSYFKIADDTYHVMLFDVSSVPQNKEWLLTAYPECHHDLARGLYCLGFEEEGVLTQLNHPLTAHEKLELRLSMPREFWPKTWLDETQA